MRKSKITLILLIVYEVIAITLIYLFTKFQLNNFLEIFLCILIVLIPFITLFFIQSSKKLSVLNDKVLKSEGLSIIKEDIATGLFKEELLDKIHSLIQPVLFYNVDEIKVVIGSIDSIIIYFEVDKVTITIDKTNIKYEYYYIDKPKEVYQEVDTLIFGSIGLYKDLIMKIIELINHELTYIEFFDNNELVGCVLKEQDNIIYQSGQITNNISQRNIYIK